MPIPSIEPEERLGICCKTSCQSWKILRIHPCLGTHPSSLASLPQSYLQAYLAGPQRVWTTVTRTIVLCINMIFRQYIVKHHNIVRWLSSLNDYRVKRRPHLFSTASSTGLRKLLMKLSSSCGRITIKIEVYCVQLINDCPQPPFLICVDRDAGIARHSGEILWHEIPESKSRTN